MRESLRKIRLETRQTRSLETLRQQFEHLQTLRRQSLDDFDLQVMIGDIHQEIVDRARYLRGDALTPAATNEDHSVVFQAPVAGPAVAATSPDPPSALATPEPAAQPPTPAAPVALLAAPAEGEATALQRLPKLKSSASGDAAEIPPEVARIDPKSWQTIVGFSVFFCVIILAVCFYLIQLARKQLNVPDENRAKTEQASKPASVAAAVSLAPTLRLYTDLAAGTVTIDGGAPRELVEGELMLDNLPAGQHSIKVAGSSGSASFDFEVAGKNAPKVIGVPQASNALAVLVSEQDGHGQLVTSAGPSDVLVDGKSVGQANAAGLELASLGATDHDLQVVHERDRQRFVMTYTPAPVLTVYVKSDPNTGIIQVMTGEDGADIYIEDVLFRRKTEHGQVRISIRAGRYPIRVHKDGFLDPPTQWIEVQKGDVTQATFELSPVGNIASLQIRGALPGTTAYIDHDFVAAIGPDGAAKISNIKPGDHSIELRHDLAVTKRLQRTFHAGEVLTLSGADVTLEKNPSGDAAKPGSPVVAAPVKTDENSKPANAAPAESQPEGTRLPKGGGFINYDTPKGPGHYSFRTQGRVGGILKKSKLQWYAGFKDNQNYILFSLDGKHAEVREVRNGKSIVWNRIACSVDSSSWVQVDLAVKAGVVSSRVKTDGEGWVDIGAVSSFGRDFTQDKVGFYIPPNDEVAVANFKFANR